MTGWVVREATEVFRRRHKITRDDLVEAPNFVLCAFLSNMLFGELSREEMLRTYPTWQYGEAGWVDPSFLKHTQDPRRGISYEDVPDGIHLEQPFVSKISGTDLSPMLVGQPTPIALAPDGRIVREIAKNNRSQINALVDQILPLEWLSTYLRAASGRTSSIPHLSMDVLPLFQLKYPNYYHWMMDELPKLRALEHYPGEATVVVDSKHRSYVGESLEHFGYTDYIRIEDTPVTVDSILAPIHQSPKYVNISYVDDEHISWLRESIEPYVDDDSEGERIYVSRENSNARQVMNREYLMDELAGIGFESYALEERSLEENLRLFANAETVVAPHGAGLTDIAFSTDIDVVELSPLPTPPPAFYVLAEQAGHSYCHIPCQAVNEAKYDIQRNMRADVDEVVRTVESLLE